MDAMSGWKWNPYLIFKIHHVHVGEEPLPTANLCSRPPRIMDCKGPAICENKEHSEWTIADFWRCELACPHIRRIGQQTSDRMSYQDLDTLARAFLLFHTEQQRREGPIKAWMENLKEWQDEVDQRVNIAYQLEKLDANIRQELVMPRAALFDLDAIALGVGNLTMKFDMAKEVAVQSEVSQPRSVGLAMAVRDQLLHPSQPQSLQRKEEPQLATEDFQKHIDEQDARFASLESSVKGLSRKADNAAKIIQHNQEHLMELKTARLSKIEDQLEKSESQLTDLHAEIQQINGQQKTHSDEFAQVYDWGSKVDKLKNNHSVELEALRVQVRNMETELSSLEKVRNP